MMHMGLPDSFQILLFIFAGIAWTGIALLGAAVYFGLKRVFKPKPKPTQWHKDWEAIERNFGGDYED